MPDDDDMRDVSEIDAAEAWAYATDADEDVRELVPFGWDAIEGGAE